MNNLKELLDGEARRVSAEPDALDAVLRLRDRKRRNQRIAAGLVGIAVFVAAVWVVTSMGSLDRSETSVVPGGDVTGPAETGPAETGPTETGPAYNGPTYSLGPVTNEDLAVGEAFMQAWVDGDGEAAAAMFAPNATFDGFQPAIFPALYDWFRAGGWTFGGGECNASGGYGEPGAPLDVVGCGFTFENDLTRALGMRPVPKGLSFTIEAGMIETAWFGGGGDCCHNMFGSPDPLRPDLHRGGGGRDLSGAVWDMFIEWLSTSHAEDFDRMYDPDYGYPVPGYPILDTASIKLWERYTDEFIASPQALRRSFTEWMANQSFEVQAGRICMTATQEFRATKPGLGPGDGAAFWGALADASEETLVELRALPLDTEADRATMDAFVPLAERWIERFRQGAAEGATHLGFDTGSYIFGLNDLIDGCLLGGVLPY
jgi:hypothetical protein